MSSPASLPHIRALDGVRGIAVAAVLVFHGRHLEGGYLGVDLFFVLSGFLITSLLLSEARQFGTVGLVGFWARRARRLLPALFIALLGVAAYCSLVAEPTELERIRGDALATLGYVANWRFVVGGFDYWELFSRPSPLAHTWSLAIEEQFYVVWPLVFACVLAWGSRRDGTRADATRTARRIFIVSIVGGCATAVLAIALWFGSEDATRIYYGTDTRAPAILFGAALGAFVSWRGPVRSQRGRLLLEVVGLISIAYLTVAWVRLAGVNLYRGGLLMCAVAGVGLIASAAHPKRGPIGWALSNRPLVGLGLISYGAYLYHWPIYVWLNEERVGLSGWPLLGVRLVVTLVAAFVSYRFVEQPIRRGAFTSNTMRWLTPVAAAALIAVMLTTTFGAKSLADTVGPPVSPAVAADIAREKPGARRLMVVGNSLGYFLGAEGFVPLKANPPLVTLNMSVVACSFPPASRIRFGGFGRGIDTNDCRILWDHAVNEFDPEVVLLSFGDAGDAQLNFDGEWVGPCDEGYRWPMWLGLDAAIRTLSAGGAHIVLSTSAYSEIFGYKEEWAVNTDCANSLVEQYAEHHRELGFIDLREYVCPSLHECKMQIDGIDLREDGMHYRGEGAQFIANWMLPQLGFDGDPPRTVISTVEE